MQCDWCGEPITQSTLHWVRQIQERGVVLLNQAFHKGDCYESGVAHSRSKETRWSGARQLEVVGQ